MVAARADGERWLTVREAATRLGVSYMTVVNRVATGKLRGKRFPPFDHLGISATDVERLTRERRCSR